jgi:hypothetical protein
MHRRCHPHPDLGHARSDERSRTTAGVTATSRHVVTPARDFRTAAERPRRRQPPDVRSGYDGAPTRHSVSGAVGIGVQRCPSRPTHLVGVGRPGCQGRRMRRPLVTVLGCPALARRVVGAVQRYEGQGDRIITPARLPVVADGDGRAGADRIPAPGPERYGRHRHGRHRHRAEPRCKRRLRRRPRPHRDALSSTTAAPGWRSGKRRLHLSPSTGHPVDDQQPIDTHVRTTAYGDHAPTPTPARPTASHPSSRRRGEMTVQTTPSAHQ